ncbi:MAG: ABC transporter ATP-binding protein [Thermales bacterium]|nr:ABC transporter ATP-binding protein [Thermales bacterium]
MSKLAISIKNLSKTYSGGIQALKSIDLTLKEGDFFALLGANGAGKTTVIGILTGLVTKTYGEVKVFGHDLDTELNEVKNSIGVVPQEFNFNIFEKVYDIVCRQGGYYGMDPHKAATRTEKVLKKLELWDKKDQKSIALSGGMKRRLMIARALVHDPKLLILDEPTAGVDVELRRGMWEYLKELNKNGTTILLTTHYLEEVEELCQYAAMIKEGEIVLNDTVRKLLNKLDQEVFVFETDKSLTSKAIQILNAKDRGDNVYEINTSPKNTLQDNIDIISKSKANIISIKPKGNRIENLFLSVISK